MLVGVFGGAWIRSWLMLGNSGGSIVRCVWASINLESRWLSCLFSCSWTTNFWVLLRFQVACFHVLEQPIFAVLLRFPGDWTTKSMGTFKSMEFNGWFSSVELLTWPDCWTRWTGRTGHVWPRDDPSDGQDSDEWSTCGPICFSISMTNWCVLRREWIGCWGLLGWLLLVILDHSGKSLLGASKMIGTTFWDMTMCIILGTPNFDRSPSFWITFLMKTIIWLVVWNMFSIIYYMWCHPSHWLIFFKIVKTTNQLYIGGKFSLIPDVPWHRPCGVFSEELKIVPLTSAQQAPWQAASSMEKRLILLQNKWKYHRDFFCQHFTIFRHSFHSNLSKYEHVGGQYPFFLRVLCGSRHIPSLLGKWKT